MKFVTLLAAAAVLSFDPVSMQAQQASANASASATAAVPHLVGAVPAMLTGAVSSGSAHVGQAVLAKLTNQAALSNGVKLPSGSQLLGHVSQVQSLSSGKGTSQLGMIFDRVKMPGVGEQAIESGVLRSIGSGKPATSADSQAESQASGGGGLLGGVTNTVGSTVSGVVGTTGKVLGTVTSLPGVLLGGNGVLGAQGKDVTVPSGTSISVGASASAAAR